MASLTKQLGDAVVAYLNAGTFGLEFTAERRWKASFELEALEDLQVVVVPGPLSTEIYDRGVDDERRYIHLAVLRQVRVDKRGEPVDEDVDPLVELLEAFLPYFRGAQATLTERTAGCVGRGLVNPSASIIDEKHLNDQNTFVAVMRLEWRMLN